MRRMGLTPQKPKFRSYRRDESAVEAWLAQQFPQLQQDAKNNAATILFADEAGMRADYHVGRTWGMRGTTPVLQDSGQKFRVNIIGAISSDGEIQFRTHEGSTTADTFVAFLRQLLDERQGPLYIVVDNLSVHSAQVVKNFLETNPAKERIQLHFLPTYSPELNPIELVWSHVKREVGKQAFKTRQELKELLIRSLQGLRATPDRIQAFFTAEDCKYIIA